MVFCVSLQSTFFSPLFLPFPIAPAKLPPTSLSAAMGWSRHRWESVDSPTLVSNLISYLPKLPNINFALDACICWQAHIDLQEILCLLFLVDVLYLSVPPFYHNQVTRATWTLPSSVSVTQSLSLSTLWNKCSRNTSTRFLFLSLPSMSPHDNPFISLTLLSLLFLPFLPSSSHSPSFPPTSLLPSFSPSLLPCPLSCLSAYLKACLFLPFSTSG